MTTSKNGGLSDYNSGEYHDKIFTFELAKKNETPSMKRWDGKPMMFPPSELVPLQDEIYDASVKKRRIIRYIPGEPSIYKDEQSPDDKNPKTINQIQFVLGHKIVDGTEPLLLDFMMKSNFNASNPNRDAKKTPLFKLLDRANVFKSVIEKDQHTHKAKDWCYNAPWDEVFAYARVLSIPGLLQKDSSEVRWDMSVRATSQPTKFMDGLKDPNMKKKHHILEAIDRGVLVVNERNNSICWSSNLDSPLKTAPIGINPVDVLVDSIITPDGERFYNSLMGMLYPQKTSMPEASETDKAVAKTFTEKQPKDLISMADITNMELAKLIEKGIEQGIIVKNGAWATFEGKKYHGEELMREIKGSEELLRMLQEKLN